MFIKKASTNHIKSYKKQDCVEGTDTVCESACRTRTRVLPLKYSSFETKYPCHLACYAMEVEIKGQSSGHCTIMAGVARLSLGLLTYIDCTENFGPSGVRVLPLGCRHKRRWPL